MDNTKINEFHIPRWKELPNIPLYLDQVVTILESSLQEYLGNDEEKIITKMMINNYVKHGILPAPEKKKYNKSHIATLFVICILKHIYSINDISILLNLALKTTEINLAYDSFCMRIENSIKFVFNKKGFLENDGLKITDQKYLLRSVAFSFANKLYVEKMYLSK